MLPSHPFTFKSQTLPWKWRHYISHRNNTVRTSNHITSKPKNPPPVSHNMLQKLKIFLYAWTLQMIASTCNKKHTKQQVPIHNQMEALNNNISKMQSIPPVHRAPAVFFSLRHYELKFECLYPSLTAAVIIATIHIITIHHTLPIITIVITFQ